MGMLNPPTTTTENFVDVIGEDTPFVLTGIRIVKATTNYGEGDMVVIKTNRSESELSIWGSYLATQARAVEQGDFNKTYVITRKLIPGFGKNGRPVKAFVPYQSIN